jgi:hypothetical protein
MNQNHNHENIEKRDGILDANKFGARKPCIYFENYKEYFKLYRDEPINLLELGVETGNSLLLWREYFSKGNIVGLDIEPCNIEDPSGRIHIYQGSQEDRNLLNLIREETAPSGFDIIIDDASHVGELTRISFWHLFENHLKAGGLYVIEDWRTGYWNTWRDGAPYKIPSLEPDQLERVYNLLGRVLRSNRITRKIFRHFLRHIAKKRFPSHQYGMVGVIKQLVDELGMDAIKSDELGERAITELQANNSFPPRFPKFREMKITPGQVFIIKSTDNDNELITDLRRHSCRRI